jgi:bacterioferritin-associated ferredoxin
MLMNLQIFQARAGHAGRRRRLQLTMIRIHYYDTHEMYVCVCHAVTDRDIRKAVDRGACSLFDVQCELPVGSCCGRCQETAEKVVDEQLQARAHANAA